MRSIILPSNIHRAAMRVFVAVVLCVGFVLSIPVATAQSDFRAIGPAKPVVPDFLQPSSPVPHELRKVAVEVHFDLVPTIMLFSLPCYPCMVTENNIHYSNGWTETYDPKASNSCEVLWDREAKYARMWIESQNPARIIVRVRAALCDTQGAIAHSDIPSGSPYGKGDWTDEWYYIYPDGTHTRHVRIYTGLAAQSLTVTDLGFREIPPNVVHEFQEEFIFGLPGHMPEDDIDLAPLTLIMMDGRSRTISYKPYPKDFGEFTKANIKVVNLKSKYRPYIIAVPYGIENEPYPPEDDLPHVFQTWPRSSRRGYSTSLGHILNWWHYRRTPNTLEQVYLSGMIHAMDPAAELVPLAWSWIAAPRLHMEGWEPSYKVITYDPAQRAYMVPRDDRGPRAFEFTLEADQRRACSGTPTWIINPAFLVKDWGESDVSLEVNSKPMQQGDDFRLGYEETPTGKDLIIWLKMKTSEPVAFSLAPK